MIALSRIDDGFFITIPNPLKQLPAENLIISEASLTSVRFKNLNSYPFFNYLRNQPSLKHAFLKTESEVFVRRFRSLSS